jgi:hypothetical protein
MDRAKAPTIAAAKSRKRQAAKQKLGIDCAACFMDLVACLKESMQGANGIHVTLICGNGKEISRNLTVISGFSLNFPPPPPMAPVSSVFLLVRLGWPVDRKYGCVFQWSV